MITYPRAYPCIGECSHYQNFDTQRESPFLEASIRGQVYISGSYLCVLHEGTQAAFYALMPTIPIFDMSAKSQWYYSTYVKSLCFTGAVLAKDICLHIY